MIMPLTSFNSSVHDVFKTILNKQKKRISKTIFAWKKIFFKSLSLLLLLLLSEVLNPKGRPIKARPQTKKYFKPYSQIVLRCMLSD